MRKGLLVTLILVLGFGMGVGVVWQEQVHSAQAAVPTPNATWQVSSQSQLYRTIYQKVNPSVVSIHVQIPNTTSDFNGQSGQAYQQAAGSGFIYDTDGHIVTNAHVVQDATQIEVTFSDGVMLRASLTGIDLDSDLAVIQVQGDLSKYPPVAVADSSLAQVGDTVVAIGNPFNEANTMTTGIVSAVHRTVQGLHSSGNSTYSIPDAIQTDAALNPGNSGGPLLNENGDVIGVNEQIEAPAGQSSGISFAIASNLVSQFVPQLIANGKVDHPYLGVSTTTLTLDLNASLKLPENTRGALVTGISASSPASAAGLKAVATSNRGATVSGGDVITAIDGQPILTSDDLVDYLFTRTSVGQTITITVLRNGRSVDLKIKLQARPA
jgi:S1-C subfamily serine protease